VLATTAIQGGQAVTLAAAAAAAPDDASTSFWALFLTTLLTLIFQAYREQRDRKWKKEDADEKAEIARLARENRELTEQKGRELSRKSDVIAEKIDANTEISKQAFAAANDLNTKMLKTQETVASAAATVAEVAKQQQ
jgi:hypothetical protein